ncbi:hypothetical protein DYH09_05460 [bacterium CPR1]|nr:hypothetical protein [bacterium CPR1]
MAILLIALLSGAAVEHLLGLKLEAGRADLEAAQQELSEWARQHPEIKTLEETRARAERSELALGALRETPVMAAGQSLLLAAIDSLGTDLTRFGYEGGTLIVQSKNLARARERLETVPGVTGLTESEGQLEGVLNQ